jgi:hypothetical protein
MATGSYEGYLPTEGISDHHEAPFFHEKTSTVILAVSASSDPYTRPKEGCTASSARAKAGEREGGIRGLRQGCQRLDRFERRGKKTPTLVGRPNSGDEVRVR